MDIKGENMSVNGDQTKETNVRVLGAFKLARRAYEDFVTQHGPEPVLPGLQQYNDRQLFWLSAASSMCEVIKDEYMRHIVRSFSSLFTFKPFV